MSAQHTPALIGAALLKRLLAQGKLTRREVELIAALQDAATALCGAHMPNAERAARAAIAKATGSAE